MDIKDIYEILMEHGNRLSELNAKHDATREDIAEIKKELGRNSEDVRYHIKRTDLAEQNLEILKQLHQDNQKKIKQNDERIEKLEKPLEATQWLASKSKEILAFLALAIGVISKIAGWW